MKTEICGGNEIDSPLFPAECRRSDESQTPVLRQGTSKVGCGHAGISRQIQKNNTETEEEYNLFLTFTICESLQKWRLLLL